MVGGHNKYGCERLYLGGGQTHMIGENSVSPSEVLTFDILDPSSVRCGTNTKVPQSKTMHLYYVVCDPAKDSHCTPNVCAGDGGGMGHRAPGHCTTQLR